MRSRNWKLVVVGLSVMLAAAGFASEAAPQEKKISIQPSEVPAVIKSAIEKAFVKGRIIAIQQEVEGENPGQYDVDIRSDGKEYEVEISAEGKVIETKEKTSEMETAEAGQGKKWTDSFNQENWTF